MRDVRVERWLPPDPDDRSMRQWPSDFRLVVEVALEDAAVACYVETLDPTIAVGVERHAEELDVEAA